MEKRQTSGKAKARVRAEWPKDFRVVFHNDDVTTMEFVVMVLRVVFFKEESEAEGLMLKVHRQGKATVGVYPRDIAVSKREKAAKMAKEAGYPLRITCEEE